MLCHQATKSIPSAVRRSALMPNVVGASIPQRLRLARLPSPARAFTDSSAPPPPQPNGQMPRPSSYPSPPPREDRTFANFHIYKTRAAFSVTLLPPTFAGRDNGSRILERNGCLMLEFANANPQAPGAPQGPAGSINRTYNWGGKVNFALTPMELGVILAGDGLASDKGLTLYHDPAKLGKNGEPLKRLIVKQLQDGNLSFTLVAGPDNFSVPVTRGEFEVFKSVAHFAIPRLLGLNELFSS